MSVSKRRLLLLFSLTLTVCCAGCGGPKDARPVTAATNNTKVSEDKLRDEIDEVLTWTYQNRHLNLRDHAAWQILHGVLAFQQDFMVDNNGKPVSAINHILQGGKMTGWVARPGTEFPATGRRGLQTVLEPGSKTGQGHADQWLAYMAQCALPPDQTIIVDGETFTIEDMISQSLWDVPRNVQQEFSWTIVALTSYLPTDYSWTAQDGKTWTIEELVQIEAESDIHTAACGGTHRLSGLTMALNRHLAGGGKLEGGWKIANDTIQKAKHEALMYQNPDGSFSSDYLARPGVTSDLGHRISTSGHVLEFLTLASTDEELRSPAMMRAVDHMCQLFRQTKKIDLECGGLYHAAHGLALYRDRMFGHKNYAEAPSGEKVAQAAVSSETETTP